MEHFTTILITFSIHLLYESVGLKYYKHKEFDVSIGLPIQAKNSTLLFIKYPFIYYT